ncbi:MAG: MFS transporter [Elusimicrobia bacterium]|nr:MFS transporter [Elusimicrobiota bacterium]
MFRSLKHRNFRLFFAGQFVSLTGSWMQQTALAWLVYRLTHDPWHLGLVGFVGQMPAAAFGLYAGVLVDRVERRRLVLVTQSLALLQAAILAVLALSGRIELWHLYALSAFAGAINAFDLPARQVMIGQLVPPEDRHNAIALNSTIVNGSRIIGPSVAGVLVGLWGEGICFAANAASYLAVLWALWAMDVSFRAAGTSEASASSEIRSGLGYTLAHEPIRILLFLLAITSLAGLPFLVLMPIFADEILHRGSEGLGLLMGASGVGATAGALWLARRRSAAGLERIVVRVMFVFGAALLVFSGSRSLPLSLAAMAVLGLGIVVQFAGVNTLLQELSEERFRGRVMAFYGMVFMIANPLGNFLAGSLASHIGAPWTVALGGCFCLVFALRHVEYLPRVMRLKARSEGIGLRAQSGVGLSPEGDGYAGPSPEGGPGSILKAG